MLNSTLKKSVFLLAALSLLTSGACFAKDKTKKVRIADTTNTSLPAELPGGAHVEPIFEQLNQQAENGLSHDRGITDATAASVMSSAMATPVQPMGMAPPQGYAMPSQPIYYLYEFSADWCPSCQVLKPHVERLAQMYNGPVRFVPINVDNPASKSLVKKLGINSIPTLVIYDPIGKAMRVMVGLQQGMQLERVLTESLREKGQPAAMQ